MSKTVPAMGKYRRIWKQEQDDKARSTIRAMVVEYRTKNGLPIAKPKIKRKRALLYRFTCTLTVWKNEQRAAIPVNQILIRGESLEEAIAHLESTTRKQYGPTLKLQVEGAEYHSNLDGDWEIVHPDLIRQTNKSLSHQGE